MKKLLNKLGAAAVAVGVAFPMAAKASFTETTNIVVNGVSWTVTLDTSNNTALIGNGTGLTSSTGNAAVSGSAYPTSGGQVVTIPSFVTVDGTDYRVTTLGVKSFSNIQLGAGIVIPSTVTTVGNYAFYQGQVTNYCFKGPNSVPVGTAQTEWQTIAASARYVCWKNSARRFILVGPNVKCGDRNPLLDCDGYASLLTVLLPSRSDNTTWDSATTGTDNKDFGGGDKTTICRYGPAQEFDLLMGDTYVTAIPTTANALTNVLNWAQTFKTAFNLDTRISITNRIDMSVAVTEEMLQNVTLEAPPWYLTFAVTSQAQLDNVLAAVSADVPIIIDIEGAGSNQITVPNGRKVAILAKSGWTFGKKLNGLIISFF